MKVNFKFWKSPAVIVKNRWHKWFAWYPVYVGEGSYRWLETVYRRCVCHEPDISPKYYVYEYEAKIQGVKRIYVVSDNRDRFLQYSREHQGRGIKYIYVSDPQYLRGLRDIEVKFIGQWWENSNIDSIMEHLCICGYNIA